MDAFISYSRDDEAIVRDLRSDLMAMGLKAFIDEELSGGQSWWDEILERIAITGVFLVAASQAARESEACKSEVSYARLAGRPIVPVRIDNGIDPTTAPSPLPEYQWIDYLTGSREEILALARSLLAVDPTPPLESRPDPPPVPGSYLLELRSAIDASELSLQSQAALLHQLQFGIKSGKDRPQLLGLAKALRSRVDLYASIADEIDKLLGAASSTNRVRLDDRDEPGERTETPEAGAEAVEPTANHDMAILEAIGAVTTSVSEGESDMFFHPDIPDNKLTKATTAAKVPDDERILFLINCTVFGSAKDCVLFGRRGLYAHNTGGPAAIPYDSIDSDAVSVESNAWNKKQVNVDGRIITTLGSGVAPQTVVDILKAVLAEVRA